MEKEKQTTVYLDWVPVEVTYSTGQIYEIYVDAIVKASALSTPKATFNIQKTAEITAEEVSLQQSTFNIEKPATISSSLGMLFQSVLNISKSAEITVDTFFSFQTTFNIHEIAGVNTVVQPNVERFLSFKISLSLQHDLALGLQPAAFEIAMTMQHAKIGMGVMPMYQITMRILKESQ